MRLTPFPADLSEGLDGRGTGGADPLAGLDDVDWSALAGAFDGGRAVRALLVGLASAKDGAWGGEPMGDLRISLQTVPIHLGTCYPTTPPAATFVARIFATGGLTHTSRLELLSWLLWAAGRPAGTLLDDLSDARADGRPPRSAEWTLETRRAVGAELPLLLTSWDREPISVRFGLAALAGVLAEEAGDVVDQVEDLAIELENTSHGQIVDIAGLLLTGDDDGAAEAARTVAAWHEDLPLPRIDESDDVPSALLAGHVLGHVAAPLLPCW